MFNYELGGIMIDEFANYIYLKTDYDFNTINRLWNFYNDLTNYEEIDYNEDELSLYEFINKKYSNKINYELLDILMHVYSIVPKEKDYLIIGLVSALHNAVNYLNEMTYFYFEEEFVNTTKETIYDNLNMGIQSLDVDDNLKKYCQDYLDKKIDIKKEKTYQEDFVYDFFEEDFKTIDDQIIEYFDLGQLVNEAYKIYEYLINLDYLKDKPKYFIKNIISFCYHENELICYGFNEKINFCLALAHYKEIKNVKEINEFLYNFFDNQNIQDKFKDKYFIFGVLYFADDIEMCKVDKNSDFYTGNLYFQSNKSDDSYIQTLLDSIYNYWNDLDIKKRNKDFQLGIIYEGIKNIQENLEYWVEDDYEDDYELRKIL